MGCYAARILNGQFWGNKHHFIIPTFCADSKYGLSFWIRLNVNKLSKFLAQRPKGGLRLKPFGLHKPNGLRPDHDDDH